MRANSTNPFDQIKVLHPVALLSSFLDAAMSITQADRCTSNNFAIHYEFEKTRFFQGRMLRPDGDGKAF